MPNTESQLPKAPIREVDLAFVERREYRETQKNGQEIPRCLTCGVKTEPAATYCSVVCFAARYEAVCERIAAGDRRWGRIETKKAKV